MKKFFSLLAICLLAATALVAGNCAISTVMVGGVSTAAVNASLQQIMFIKSIQEEYYKIDTWMDRLQDLSAFVVDNQTLRFPEGGAKPSVYKNRTTDVDSVEVEETYSDLALVHYDSQNYKMRDINMHALPYDKVAYYTRLSADAIKLQEVADAAYALAPTTASTTYHRIVVPSTGSARDGFKMVKLEDIQTLARACDKHLFPKDGRNLVLPSDMWWDLVSNNDILKNQLGYQAANGNINPTIVNYYGFDIHNASDNSMIPFNVSTQTKASQGAAITGNVVPAGFVFVVSETCKATGAFKMYNKDITQNTEGRAYEFGFSHKFVAGFNKSQQRYSALLYLALSA